jgi:hypothetical protein
MLNVPHPIPAPRLRLKQPLALTQMAPAMFIVAIGLTFALAAFGLEKLRKHTSEEEDPGSMHRISTTSEEVDLGSMPGISATSEEEDLGSMPRVSATYEEEDPGSIPVICNGVTTEEDGGGPRFHTRDLQPVP